ncbi:hypothetical protein TcasGA2_TC010248 [Tribolium castaneum]|uniref:Uncharacterized protein n=1 Tax=Tribolium castaneum TaxID=7070 RepID=D7EJ94_TRICA|nr:hypothetical protein TcasGA2_TC010248 [Tribolium castaneum]
MAPNDVNPDNVLQVYNNIMSATKKDIKRIKPKNVYTVGDYVRITKYKHVFEKGYMSNWSGEIFKITDVIMRQPVVYKISDLMGEPIEGVFYHPELQCVTYDPQSRFHIEKVLKKRYKRVMTKYKTKIEAGNYETIESIVEALNSIKILVLDNVTFRINDGSKRIIVTSNNKHLTSMSFSPILSLQLGFQPDTNVLNKTSTHPANIMLGLPGQLFVYSDIIEPQLIGDVLAKVIRIVVIDNKHYIYGTHHTQLFSHPHYIPLLKREFENIEIDIRNATGKKVPFQFGTVCVKLHFKKIS